MGVIVHDDSQEAKRVGKLVDRDDWIPYLTLLGWSLQHQYNGHKVHRKGGDVHIRIYRLNPKERVVIYHRGETVVVVSHFISKHKNHNPKYGVNMKVIEKFFD